MWTFDPSDGELLIQTGVTGRAARMGHRLTIVMTRWQATVTWTDGEPETAQLAVEADSLQVLTGAGGVKSLSGAEKAVVRSNALRSLNTRRFPEIHFASRTIVKSADGYRLSGTLQIHGKTRQHVIDLHTEDLGDSWRMTAQSSVRQSAFGVKPYSLLMGSLQVADDVTLSFTAVHAKDD